jgi:tetratricopeptide (TPR) repeat protein
MGMTRKTFAFNIPCMRDTPSPPLVVWLPCVALLLLASLCNAVVFAQSSSYANRAEALKGLAASEAAHRAEAVIWIANNGTSADDKVLRPRLVDESPVVRELAEQGIWVLWGRSGDSNIDLLMAKGAEEIQSQQLPQAIATYSEVIRRKPSFAEGWNRRATVYFLAGDFKRSLADCDQVTKRNPLHFGALAGYGQIYFQLKRYDKAIEYWKRALQANPNMAGLEANIDVAEKLLAEARKHSA